MPLSGANPILYYKMDESGGSSAVDQVAAVNLTDHNTVGSTAGIQGNARSFVSASSRYLSHADTALLRGGDVDWSYSFWFNTTNAGGSGIQLVSKDMDSPANSRDYTIDLNATGLRFYINGGGGGLLVGSALTIANSTNYHVCCGHDSVNDLLWVQVNNETRVTQATGGAVPQTTSAEFRVGARAYSGLEGYFDGWIDEIAKFNYALTTGDVTYLWNGSAGLSYTDIFGGGAPSAAQMIGIFDQQAIGGCVIGRVDA